MEQRDLLTADPLRFDGAARGAAALRRLEAASVRIAPLEDAGHGLEALTRVRLADLTSPGRGDGALADVLARLASATGADDGAIDAPAPRRLGMPMSRAGHVRVAPVAPGSPGRRAAHGARPAANGRPLPFAAPEPLASRRRTQAIVPEQQRGPALALPDAVEAPDAPNGFEVAGAVRGLEWLAVRVPGGAESSETPLVDGATEVSPVRHTLAASAEPGAAVLAHPVPDFPAPVPHEVERPLETRSSGQPLPRTSDRDAPRRRVGGTRGLDALVRAWQDTQPPPSPEQVELFAEPVASVAANRSGSARTGTASGTRAPVSQASEREEETLVFGDALARVLVGELRRYGIEVDAG
jgi:hypothetical protein